MKSAPERDEIIFGDVVTTQRRFILAIALALSAIAMVLGVWSASIVYDERRISTIVRDRVAPLHELYLVTRDVRQITDLLGARAQPGDRDEIGRLSVEIESQWGLYRGTYLTVEEQEIARRDDEKVRAIKLGLAPYVRVGENEAARVEVAENIRPAARDILLDLDRLVDLQKRVAFEEMGLSERMAAHLETLIVCCAVLAMAAIAYLVLLARSAIFAPLAQTRQVAKAWAEGKDADLPRSDGSEFSEVLGELKAVRDRYAGDAAESRRESIRLAEMTMHFESIFRHCPFGVFIKDLEGRLLTVNDREAEIYGSTREAMLGSISYQYVPSRDHDHVKETDRKVVETGDTVTVEYSGEEGDSYKFLKTIKFPVRNREGEIVGIGGVAIDISSERAQSMELERHVKQLDRAAQHSKSFFLIAIEDPNTGVVTRRFDKERLKEWVGFDEFPPPDEFLLGYVHPEDQEITGCKFKAMYEGKISSYQSEFRLKRPNGEYFPVRIWRERGIEANTGIVVSYALWQDISEQKLREQELIVEKQRAEQADHSKTQFLRNMSHELRTPLNPVIGFSELLMTQFEKNGDSKNAGYAKYIHEGGCNLLAIINTILEFARYDGGDFVVTESSFLIGGAVNNCIDNVCATLNAVREQFSVKWLGDEMWIQADKSGFQRAVTNVLLNAAQYGREKIEIELVVGPKEFRLIIGDDGPGISPELIAEIGKPFTRGGDVLNQAQGGVGLGLTIAEKLMRAHGGRLEVANSPLGGASVSMMFPLERLARERTPEAVLG